MESKGIAALFVANPTILREVLGITFAQAGRLDDQEDFRRATRFLLDWEWVDSNIWVLHDALRAHAVGEVEIAHDTYMNLLEMPDEELQALEVWTPYRVVHWPNDEGRQALTETPTTWAKAKKIVEENLADAGWKPLPSP